MGNNNTKLIDSLNFFANNGLLYNTSTFINNFAVSYTGTRLDAVLGATALFTKYNLFSGKNGNAYRQFEDNIFAEKITILPLINISYSFNDEKNKKIGTFAGNQGGLFGAGVYTAYEINQYISFGGSAGAYFGFQDILGLIKATNIIDPNYSIKEDSNTIMQANFAVKFSL